MIFINRLTNFKQIIFPRTTLVMVGVGVFFIICHSFYYLLYQVRLICIRTSKTRNDMDRNKEECSTNGGMISAGTEKADLEC